MNKGHLFLSLLLSMMLISEISPGQPIARFSPGEKLHYSAWFNFVKGGESTLQIVGIDTVNTMPVFHVQSVTESLPFFDRFYKVRDYMESWIDMTGMFSYRFSKSIREGNYKKKYTVDFNYQRLQAISKTDSNTIPIDIHDGLSMFYYVRTLDLGVGDVIEINFYDNDMLRPFMIKVDKIELVKTPVGEIECFVLSPFLESGKMFKQMSKITIHVSTDKRRLPVMISNSARFGTLTLKLESIESPR